MTKEQKWVQTACLGIFWTFLSFLLPKSALKRLKQTFLQQVKSKIRGNHPPFRRKFRGNPPPFVPLLSICPPPLNQPMHTGLDNEDQMFYAAIFYSRQANHYA
jgi:hypothetical protein